MKRQPGFEVAEKLSALQRALNIKTKKMKELAAQINMYQAKVPLILFRQTNLIMTLKKPKNKSRR
mgnify:CR=1 FL=1